MQVVFVDGYKGLRYNVKSADQDFEIYDVTKDPKETRNLAKSPEFSKLLDAMKARALQTRVPSSAAPRPYDNALVPPSPGTPASSPGVTWKSYQGVWSWMPDFRSLSPTNQGSSGSFVLSNINTKETTGISFESQVLIPADGKYTFTVASNGGSMLFVHDKRVITEARPITSEPKSATIPLKAGWHPLRLLYRQTGGSPALKFSITDENGKDLPLHENSLRQSQK
jgi:hypothetical protein